jgi:hypothetical protein
MDDSSTTPRLLLAQAPYSKEEFAQRVNEIYETQVRAKVEEGKHGKIVAINLETGDFELDASEIAACDSLSETLCDRLKLPHLETQIWIVRISSRHVCRFGGRT